jgi:hypothetical protein
MSFLALPDEECLLSIPQILIEKWVCYDVTQHFEAFTDELSSLPDIWVEHVQMIHILIANITWSASHCRILE